jgi:hypothetical protein
VLDHPLEVKCPTCDGTGLIRRYWNDRHQVICDFCEGSKVLELTGVKQTKRGVFTAYGPKGERALCESEERKRLKEIYGDLWEDD